MAPDSSTVLYNSRTAASPLIGNVFCSTLLHLYDIIGIITPQILTMGDNPPSTTTYTYLRHSQPNVASKTSINKSTLNSPKTYKQIDHNSKILPNQQPSTTDNINIVIDNATQKNFF